LFVHVCMWQWSFSPPIIFMKENRSLPPRTPFRQKIILVLFGLLLFFVFLEVGLRLSGAILLSLQDYRNKLSLRHTGTYKILCLGESTTEGQYPPFLEAILNQRNIGVRFSVIDKGRAGMNTPVILRQVESYLDEYSPDMVVAMMGINDWGAHMPYDYPSSSIILRFLRSFKIYKLSQFLWLHMAAKAQEIKFLPSRQDRCSFSMYQQNALTAGKNPPKLNPTGDQACLELGRLCLEQGQLLQAEEYFKKALELNPENDQACLELGRLYRRQRQLPQAEEFYKKAFELNPENDQACLELGLLYQRQTQLPQAEERYKKTLMFNLYSAKLYVVLAAIYKATGQAARAQEYYDKADKLGLNWYKLMTVNNYRMLKDILNRRKIQLVCVQYPMRNIETLKKVFIDQGNIIFVDNEGVFKEALKTASYKEYFTDMFAGDFGHCTEKGNRLLAQNIANMILKEVFHK